MIGPSLMAVKGLGSSETATNYTRALELCQLAGDRSALFEALSGLWTFHLVRAELLEADALVQQLLASARESKDDSHLAFANFAAGNTAFWCGRLETAAERLAQSIAACKPGQRSYQVFVDDPAVYSRVTRRGLTTVRVVRIRHWRRSGTACKSRVCSLIRAR